MTGKQRACQPRVPHFSLSCSSSCLPLLILLRAAGTQSPQARKNDWTVKRVFFLTPQVLQTVL
jgi:hypothetical protein